MDFAQYQIPKLLSLVLLLKINIASLENTSSSDSYLELVAKKAKTIDMAFMDITK